MEFYPYVTLTENFFVVYEMAYSDDDSFSLKQTPWNDKISNTSFAELSSGWKPLSAISPGNAKSSLGITVNVCQNTKMPERINSPFVYYPNPSSSFLIIKINDAPPAIQLRIVDSQGKSQNVPFTIYDDNIVITTSGLSPGVYLIDINGTLRSRFIKL